VKGRWPADGPLQDELEIAISRHTANQLETDTGKSVLMYFIQENAEQPKTRKVRICGIFNTGIDVYDKVYAIGQLSLIQKMNNWSEKQIGGYEIDLKTPAAMQETGESLFQLLPPGLNAFTLKELSPEIFDWLNLQNTNKYILIAVMSIVAVINLITCLIILLLERTPMIALLKSMGARDHVIQETFILYGSWIAGIGIFCGAFLGLSICIFQQKWQFIQLNEEAYYVKTAPVSIDPSQVLLIISGTFIISMLTLIIPSLIIRRISPIRTLQFK
jgi:lipoprotein-releasing system permease protein